MRIRRNSPLFSVIAITLAATVSTLFAQPVIDHSVSPIVGDVDSGVITDTLHWDPGPAGANVEWDFTALTKVNAGSVGWVAPSSTPYAGSFPAANLCINQGGFYSYYKSEIGGYYTYGNASNSGPKVVYDKKQTVVTYPFTYHDSLYDTTTGTYEQTTVASGYTIVSTGHRTMYSKTVADGYGTLKVPGATYTNALRLKITSTTIDSISMVINGGPANKSVAIADYEQYYWVTQGTRLWAMYMSKTFIHNSGRIIKSAMITYAKSRQSTFTIYNRCPGRSVAITTRNNGFFITIPERFAPAPARFELYDLRGNRMLRRDLTTGATTFAPAALPRGAYCWKVAMGNIVFATDKVIVK
jgi:hypothetical protein